jgi:hypothetical protein
MERKKFEIIGESKKRLEILSESGTAAEVVDTTLLNDIEPIEQGGLNVENREELKYVVEPPLLEACQQFFDKDIRTVFSSANKKDIKVGHAHITLDFDFLSPVNKQVALSVGEEAMIHGSESRKGVYIKIPISESSTMGEVKRKALAIVDKFESQK